MKFLKKTTLFLLVLFALIIFFLPKTALYYQLEHMLSEEKIILSGEITRDSGFLFSIDDGTLYYDDLEVVQLKGITITPLIAFNRISFTPFTFSKDIQNFLPGTIEQMKIQYTFVDPLHIIFNAQGEFGTLNGSIAFLEKLLHASLLPSDMLLKKRPIWLKEFKKQEGGIYQYESNY